VNERKTDRRRGDPVGRCGAESCFCWGKKCPASQPDSVPKCTGEKEMPVLTLWSVRAEEKGLDLMGRVTVRRTKRGQLENEGNCGKTELERFLEGGEIHSGSAGRERNNTKVRESSVRRGWWGVFIKTYCRAAKGSRVFSRYQS